jgi:hypothetical protein
VNSFIYRLSAGVTRYLGGRNKMNEQTYNALIDWLDRLQKLSQMAIDKINEQDNVTSDETLSKVRDYIVYGMPLYGRIKAELKDEMYGADYDNYGEPPFVDF